MTFIALKSVTMLDGRFLISNSKKILEFSKIFSTPKKITQSAWLFLMKIFQDEPGAVLCILWLWRLPSSVFVYSKVQCTDCIRIGNGAAVRSRDYCLKCQFLVKRPKNKRFPSFSDPQIFLSQIEEVELGPLENFCSFVYSKTIFKKS